MRKLSRSKRRLRGERGQSLIESAILLPFLFLLLFNAINFGYFFYVAINLTSAPRDAVQYSVLGPASPEQSPYPTASAVSTFLYNSLGNGLPGSSTTPVRICSSSVVPMLNPGTTSQTVSCKTFNGGTFSSGPDIDPEAPSFVLHRVDVEYTIQPLIAGSPFGITLLKSFTVHRQVSMRAM